MTKKKIFNNKGDRKFLSNTRTWTDFMDESGFMLFPGQDEWRQLFINTLLMWAEKDTSFELMQFCMEYKFARTTLYDWRETYPDVKKAFDYVKLMLACRRRMGVLHKEMDRDMVFKDLHTLDPEWLEINRYHAELRQLDNNNHGTVIVQMLPAPHSGRVPERKKVIVQQMENEDGE